MSAGGSRGRSFKAGLRQRNPLVLVLAVVLLVPVFLLLQAFFTGGAWSSIPLKFWVRDESDDQAFVSWSVGLAKKTPPSLPSVYVLGGSTAREALVSGPSLAKEIRKLGGPRTVAWDMGSVHQTFSQSLAIVDNLPARDAWVVIGVNIGRFAATADENLEQVDGRGLLLRSEVLRRYAASHYGRNRWNVGILPGIFTYFTDLARLHGDDLRRGHLVLTRYRLHRVSQKTRHSLRSKRRELKAWYRLRGADFHQYFSMNVALLDLLLARCRERGMHAVLVELPLNRDVVQDGFDGPITTYQKSVRTLSARHGVPYLDFNRRLALPDAWFADLQHLVPPGRERWQRELASELVKLMNGASR